MHTWTLYCMPILAYWHFTLSDGNNSVSAVSQHLELLGHKTEHNALKLDKAQCSFCCYSETLPSLSPTHICKIINRCLKSLHRPAYHKHSTSLLLHFLSHHAWLCFSAFPQFHLCCSRADTLRPQTHASTHKGKHRMYREKLCDLTNTYLWAQGPVWDWLSLSNKTIITRNTYFSHVLCGFVCDSFRVYESVSLFIISLHQSTLFWEYQYLISIL